MIATLTKEKETLDISKPADTKCRTWTELRRPPQNSLRVPLVQRKGQKVKMPKRLTPYHATSPPAEAWPRIMDAIQDFGLHDLFVYAPKEAFEQQRVDPAVIAEKGGRFYLIAAWE